MKRIPLIGLALVSAFGCQRPADVPLSSTHDEAVSLVGHHVERVNVPLEFIPIAAGKDGQTIPLTPGMQGEVVALDERPKGNFGVIVRWDLPGKEGGPWTSWISRYSSKAIRVVDAPKP